MVNTRRKDSDWSDSKLSIYKQTLIEKNQASSTAFTEFFLSKIGATLKFLLGTIMLAKTSDLITQLIDSWLVLTIPNIHCFIHGGRP